MSAGLKLEDLLHRASIFSSSTLSVPKVSMCTLTGCGMADRVGKLHFAARSQAGGDDVLRHPAAHVSGAAIHLRRILAGEGAAAVPAHAAVGIDDDLAPGQAGVALRPADDETCRSG